MSSSHIANKNNIKNVPNASIEELMQIYMTEEELNKINLGTARKISERSLQSFIVQRFGHDVSIDNKK